MFCELDTFELTDPQMVDVPITERLAVIDRLHGEIAQLELARITTARADTRP